MNVLIINSVCGIRSTGRICTDIAADLEKQGHNVKIAYGRETVPEMHQKYAVKIGNELSVKVNGLKARIFDNEGFNAKSETARFLKWADKFNPDMVWLHNLHGYYINIEMLFDWIKSRPDMRVSWTLHDCWAFTGHCAHFTLKNCYKWKQECSGCSFKKSYPSSYAKCNSKNNFARKRAAFTGVKNMTVITPSKWLANFVKESFLGEYPIEVRYNTIDTDVFKPTPSDFRERYGLQNKKIILGVATAWSRAKGLYDFIELSKMLDDSYVIVLVGLTKKQMKAMPEKIIALPRTNSAAELAEIYTAADLFVNPSREETFGMTTIEAMACGTNAIVYKDTACEEIVNNQGGIAVEQDVNILKCTIEEQFDR